MTRKKKSIFFMTKHYMSLSYHIFIIIHPRQSDFYFKMLQTKMARAILYMGILRGLLTFCALGYSETLYFKKGWTKGRSSVPAKSIQRCWNKKKKKLKVPVRIHHAGGA